MYHQLGIIAMGSYWSSYTTIHSNEFNDLITKACENAIKENQLETLLSLENMQPNQVTLLKTVLQNQGFNIEANQSSIMISGWSKKPNPKSNLLIEQFKKIYRDVAYGPRLQTLQERFKTVAGNYGYDFYLDKNVSSVYGDEIPTLLQNLGYRSTYEPEKNWIITQWVDHDKPTLVEQELHALLREFEIKNQDTVDLLFDNMKKKTDENGYDAFSTTQPNSQGYARLVIQKFQQHPEYEIKPYDYYQVYEAAKTGGFPPEHIDDKQPYYIHGFCVVKKYNVQ